MKVAVIIPAYNEEQAVGEVISNLKKCFSSSPYDLEVVVVNDCSLDRTSEVAIEAGAAVIDHIINTGAGGATLTGLRFANKKGFDIAATMDADGQHLSEDVLRGIDTIQHGKADLLIGSRLLHSEGMSNLKKIGNKGLSMFTNILFGIQVTDSQSGLRVFSKPAINKLNWSSSGFEFCSEMIWRAKQLGLKVEEYPIKAIYTDYSKAKGQNNWNAINIIKSLLRRRIAELLK